LPALGPALLFLTRLVPGCTLLLPGLPPGKAIRIDLGVAAGTGTGAGIRVGGRSVETGVFGFRHRGIGSSMRRIGRWDG
jgi:hypothetical protein